MKQRELVVDLVKAAFIVLIVKVTATTSVIMPWNSQVDNLCIVFAIAVMILKICRLTLPLGRLLALAGMGLWTLYTCVSIGQYDLLVTIVAICLLIDEDLDEYIPLMLRVQTFVLIAHIAVSGFLSLIGKDAYFWRWTNDRFRFNGGFFHANVLSSYILSCMLMFSWKQFGRITANQFAGMACIAALSFILTKTRTGLLLNVILLLLIYLTQNKNQLVIKLVNAAFLLLFPALSGLIFWTTKQYTSGSSIAMVLDDILTGRIKYAAYAYLRSGTTLLPRYLDYADVGQISWTPEWNLNTFTFDNLYSFIFMQLGMVWIVIITVMFFLLFKKFNLRNRLFLLIWMLYSIVEVHGLNCFKFFPLILLSTLLSEKGGRGTSETP